MRPIRLRRRLSVNKFRPGPGGKRLVVFPQKNSLGKRANRNRVKNYSCKHEGDVIAVPGCKLWFFVSLVVVFLGAPSWSLAQGEAGQASSATSPGSSGQFTCPVTSGFILGSGAEPMGKGNFAIQPNWYLTFQGNQSDNDWRTVSAGQDLSSLSNAIFLTVVPDATA